ncbi:MAG: hypothetical protein JWN44_6885 [Myxococcales bacterium]|nr:hypothetical protein [Myxococcales bacterium]
MLITVAIAEHKDRIDVGYGLEGDLTDALTRRIRNELMEPRFKAGDFEGGLRAGIAAIDTATGGHEHEEGKLPARAPQKQKGLPVGTLVFLVIFVLIAIISRRGRGGGGGGFWIGGGGWSGGSSGWSSGGGGGGGWSGGGGSFGGGGSSGSW